MSLAEAEGNHTLFHPPPHLGATAHVKDLSHYREMYQESIRDPETFWRNIAGDYHWDTPPIAPIFQYNFHVRDGPISIKFMAGARTNICYNALDRNVLRGMGDKTAYFWLVSLLSSAWQNPLSSI